MLIDEKTLVVVAYRINIEGLLEHNTEAPTFYQVRPVAQTMLVFTVIARHKFPFVVRHFLLLNDMGFGWSHLEVRGGR